MPSISTGRWESLMRIANLIDYIAGERPDFRAPGAALRPGDRFGRHEQSVGWVYVEVTALNDGRLREGCVYARAFARSFPAGREGYCYLSQLDLRIDDLMWTALRASGWPAPGVALGLGVDEAPRAALDS
jgi:hypothetical protein